MSPYAVHTVLHFHTIPMAIIIIIISTFMSGW